METRSNTGATASDRMRISRGVLESPAVPFDQALEIAINAYIYAYPIVMMELTGRIAATVYAPFNQFNHMSAFPDASFTDVVRPNADTLYSSLFFDVLQEPLVITLPDSHGRYHLLQMMDAWTDVFASPGTRTTGDGPFSFALTGPGWSGILPNELAEIKAPTNTGWLLGRTRTDGKMDYKNVHQFQASIAAQPLSSYGNSYTPPKSKMDSNAKGIPPVDQIEQLSVNEFFKRFSECLAVNPPHANDYPILQQIERLGFAIGERFDLAEADSDVRTVFQQAVPIALKRMKAKISHAGTAANGWRVYLTGIGTYGADYLSRASVAYAGLGANAVEDAIYPIALTDAEGQPFASASKYVLHFDKLQIPPVRGFWSLTMYNDRQFFADNPIDRYAIGDRDKLKFNGDGSLDLYIQRESPGVDKESNWLPAPKSGGFTMNMRLYWPKAAALEGTWTPPAVQRNA